MSKVLIEIGFDHAPPAAHLEWRQSFEILQVGDADSGSRVSKLAKKVSQGESPDLLVIRVAPILSSEFVRLITVRRDITSLCMLKIEQLKQDFISIKTLADAVAMAHIAASNKGQAVILCNAPQNEFVHNREFHFMVEDEANFDPDLFIAIAECNGFPQHEAERSVSFKWGPYSTQLPFSARGKIDQEFARPRSKYAFRATCLKHGNEIDTLDEYRRMNLIRLCRRLSTLNVEGRRFVCTVVVSPEDQANRLVTGDDCPLFEIRKLARGIPFNEQHLDEIQEVAETAQTENSVLYVNSTNWLLECVYGCRLFGKDGRMFALASLSEELPNVMAVHLTGGFVEIYFAGQFVLWHDGFQWHATPFRHLIEILALHIKDGAVIAGAQPQSINALSDRARKILLTVAQLMDENCSSILVLLDKRDEHCLDQLLRRMRNDLNDFRPPTERLPISNLAALIRLDGAHVIDEKGDLIRIAQRIQDSDARTTRISKEEAELLQPWAVSITDDKHVVGIGHDEQILVAAGEAIAPGEFAGISPEIPETRRAMIQEGMRKIPRQDSSTSAGTGREACRRLSEKLRNSWLIKVSSSGQLFTYKAGITNPAPKVLIH